MDIILAGVFITYQCVLLDYPLEAAIRCALDLCDYVVINDGGSTDGTLGLLEALRDEHGEDRVKIIYRNWIHDRGFWARERNYVLETIPLEHYVINLAADECFHEDDLETIRSLILSLNGRAMRFTPLHFYGRPGYTIKGKHWATVLTKLWQNKNRILYYNIPRGCADDPLWPDGSPAHWRNCLDSGVRVYHYGHCRNPKALATKNEKAHSLYRNENFYVDGSFPIIKEFDYELDKYLAGYDGDKVEKFKGRHPKYIRRWCKQHARQELSYNAEAKDPVREKIYDFTVNVTHIEKIDGPLRIILALTARDELKYGKHIFMQLDDAVKRDYDEIVVLDDGSTDGTWEVLQDYAKKYNNIHIKRNEVNSIVAKGENRWITLIRECEKYHPTWIHFRACDQLHSKIFNEKIREIVTYFHERGGWLIKIPLVHLWRSEGWFRHDDVWLHDYLDHTRRQLWRFYKDYEYKPHRTIAAFHLGGHLPNKLSPHDVVPAYNINSYLKRTLSKRYWPIVVLHYGHTTHEKKEIKFRLTMEAASKGISYGCPSPDKMPHPKHWLDYNGYKGFHEFNLCIKKVPQMWFDHPIDYTVPEVKSFYDVIAEYRPDRAKEYQLLFERNKDKIPIIVKG